MKEKLVAGLEKNAPKITPPPCICMKNKVYCNGVSAETVRNVFLRVNDAEIYSLYWSDPLGDTTNTVFIPADFLGNTSVTFKIYIADNRCAPGFPEEICRYSE